RVSLEQAIQHGGHFGKHAFGQISGVRTWIGRGLMCLVQGLGDLQCLLHVQSKLLRTDLLERPQIEQQRRAFAHTLSLDRHYLSTTSGPDLLCSLLCDGLLKAATCVVSTAIGCNPLRRERLSTCG